MKSSRVEQRPNIGPVSPARLADMYQVIFEAMPLYLLLEQVQFPVKHSENDDGSEAE